MLSDTRAFGSVSEQSSSLVEIESISREQATVGIIKGLKPTPSTDGIYSSPTTKLIGDISSNVEQDFSSKKSLVSSAGKVANLPGKCGSKEKSKPLSEGKSSISCSDVAHFDSSSFGEKLMLLGTPDTSVSDALPTIITCTATVDLSKESDFKELVENPMVKTSHTMLFDKVKLSANLDTETVSSNRNKIPLTKETSSLSSYQFLPANKSTQQQILQGNLSYRKSIQSSICSSSNYFSYVASSFEKDMVSSSLFFKRSAAVSSKTIANTFTTSNYKRPISTIANFGNSSSKSGHSNVKKLLPDEFPEEDMVPTSCKEENRILQKDVAKSGSITRNSLAAIKCDEQPIVKLPSVPARESIPKSIEVKSSFSEGTMGSSLQKFTTLGDLYRGPIPTSTVPEVKSFFSEGHATINQALVSSSPVYVSQTGSEKESVSLKPGYRKDSSSIKPEEVPTKSCCSHSRFSTHQSSSAEKISLEVISCKEDNTAEEMCVLNLSPLSLKPSTETKVVEDSGPYADPETEQNLSGNSTIVLEPVYCSENKELVNKTLKQTCIGQEEEQISCDSPIVLEVGPSIEEDRTTALKKVVKHRETNYLSNLNCNEMNNPDYKLASTDVHEEFCPTLKNASAALPPDQTTHFALNAKKILKKDISTSDTLSTTQQLLSFVANIPPIDFTVPPTVLHPGTSKKLESHQLTTHITPFALFGTDSKKSEIHKPGSIIQISHNTCPKVVTDSLATQSPVPRLPNKPRRNSISRTMLGSKPAKPPLSCHFFHQSIYGKSGEYFLG